MIIKDYYSVKLTKRNTEHYSDLGYEFLDSDKELMVDVFDLTNGSRVMIKIECDVCSSIFEKDFKSSIKSNKHICSKACEPKLKELIALDKITEKFGCDFKEKLASMYVDEKKSTREIARDLFGAETKASNVIYWLGMFDIPIRVGSEAVKTQWINAEERREKASARMKDTFSDGSVRSKINKVMQTDEYREKSRLAKLGNKNPMYGVIKEEHPNWNDSLTNEHREKYRKNYENSQWRKQVLERDDNKCQKCGNKENLHVHHILNHHTHVELRYEVSNGITLCEPCHIDFHKKCGKYQESVDNMNEFIK